MFHSWDKCKKQLYFYSKCCILEKYNILSILVNCFSGCDGAKNILLKANNFIDTPFGVRMFQNTQNVVFCKLIKKYNILSKNKAVFYTYLRNETWSCFEKIILELSQLGGIFYCFIIISLSLSQTELEFFKILKMMLFSKKHHFE